MEPADLVKLQNKELLRLIIKLVYIIVSLYSKSIILGA